MTGARNEHGFVLAVVLVFFFVLSLGAYLVARMTQLDVQMVTNLHNEKQAFFAAEAGAAEALLRLRTEPTGPGTDVTIDGFTFSPDIVPVATPDWATEITFSRGPPATAWGVLVTPTVQRESDRLLPYSDVVGGTEPLLRIGWSLDERREIRTVAARPLVEIRSVGRSGAARRTVVLDAIEEASCPGGGLCALADVCGAVTLEDGARVSLQGGVTIDSSCREGPMALTLGAGSSLRARAIDVVGGYNGRGEVTPAQPRTGARPHGDPLASLRMEGLLPTGCDHSAVKLAHRRGVRTLRPGTYCGGIRLTGGGYTTFAPGLYVIAGGSLEISGNHSVRGDGVAFYVTSELMGHEAASVVLTPGGGSYRLAAPFEGPWAGILLFQDRRNANPIEIGGTFRTGLDGVIYAPAANVTIRSGRGPKGLNVGLIVGSASFAGDVTLRGPTSVPDPLPGPRGYQTIAWKDWSE